VDEFSALCDSLSADTLRSASKAVAVVWADIWDHPDTWIDFPLKDEDVEPIWMTTLGYLVHANKKVFVVAGTVDLVNNQMSQVCIIPRGCIKTITVL
jgi:hypothetical protein